MADISQVAHVDALAASTVGHISANAISQVNGCDLKLGTGYTDCVNAAVFNALKGEGINWTYNLTTDSTRRYATASFWVAVGRRWNFDMYKIIDMQQAAGAGVGIRGNSAKYGYGNTMVELNTTGSNYISWYANMTPGWHHVCLWFDSYTIDKGDMAANKCACFVDGRQLDKVRTASVGHVNTGHRWFGYYGHDMRVGYSNSSYHLDGALFDVKLIDGYCYGPEYFGEEISGVWMPKTFIGSWGPRGVWLKFGSASDKGANSAPGSAVGDFDGKAAGGDPIIREGAGPMVEFPAAGMTRRLKFQQETNSRTSIYSELYTYDYNAEEYRRDCVVSGLGWQRGVALCGNNIFTGTNEYSYGNAGAAETYVMEFGADIDPENQKIYVYPPDGIQNTRVLDYTASWWNHDYKAWLPIIRIEGQEHLDGRFSTGVGIHRNYADKYWADFAAWDEDTASGWADANTQYALFNGSGSSSIPFRSGATGAPGSWSAVPSGNPGNSYNNGWGVGMPINLDNVGDDFWLPSIGLINWILSGRNTFTFIAKVSMAKGEYNDSAITNPVGTTEPMGFGPFRIADDANTPLRIARASGGLCTWVNGSSSTVLTYGSDMDCYEGPLWYGVWGDENGAWAGVATSKPVWHGGWDAIRYISAAHTYGACTTQSYNTIGNGSTSSNNYGMRSAFMHYFIASKNNVFAL